MGDLDLLVTFAVCALIVIASAFYVSFMVRRAHPPLSGAEKEAQLESELAEINKKIEGLR